MKNGILNMHEIIDFLTSRKRVVSSANQSPVVKWLNYMQFSNYSTKMIDINLF